MPEYILTKGSRGKKYHIITPDKKVIKFGQAGASDFTINKDPKRKESYLARHKARENWSKSGIHTAGFWSRWLLWNLPTISQSISDIEKRFDIHIIKKRD